MPRSDRRVTAIHRTRRRRGGPVRRILDMLQAVQAAARVRRATARCRNGSSRKAPRSNPCSRTRRCVPARMCRSSTFCVMTVHVFESRVHCASTSCAAFGWHDAIVARRHSYHSHTSAGSRANASGVARSSARNDRHSPPAPRNVGTPLAADTPAPVSTVTRRASFRRAASFSSTRSS